MSKPCKSAYIKLKETIATRNEKAEQKWSNNLQIEYNEQVWKEVYASNFKCTKETKLRNFQYKILSRILPTNKFLYRCSLSVTPNCSFCDIYTETLEHLFFDCHITKSIYLQLRDWLLMANINVTLSLETVILGMLPRDQLHKNLITHIFLIAKYVIYTAKLQKEIPDFRWVKQKLALYYKLELMTPDQKQHEKNVQKWEPVRNFLEL